MNYLKAYHALGWVIHPLSKTSTKYKHPITKSWSTAITHINCLDLFIDKHDVNIGLITGPPSNVIILDIDPRKANESNLEFCDGVDEWIRLLDLHGQIDTVIAVTPRGGFHYYFKFDEHTKQLYAGNKQWKCEDGRILTWDIKGITENGKVCNIALPPSINPNTGSKYTWIKGCEPWATAVATMPDWLYQMLVNNRIIKKVENLSTFSPIGTHDVKKKVKKHPVSNRVIGDDILKQIKLMLKLRFGNAVILSHVDSPYVILKNVDGYFCPDCKRIHDHNNPMIHVDWRNQLTFDCGCKNH